MTNNTPSTSGTKSITQVKKNCMHAITPQNVMLYGCMQFGMYLKEQGFHTMQVLSSSYKGL